MSKQTWTPWHRVVRVRDDLRSGELSLAMFAADLYDVVMRRGSRIYWDPREFFALTYPTVNLRELAKDVALRLDGRNDKAVRQLALTYGGGKTHTLITLYHLASDPESLPDLPAVGEFLSHIGSRPPRARVAAITFDRLDPVTGMEVRSPDGEVARFKYPWSVLAFQLGGKAGLEILGSVDGAEREEPPFTNVLEDLLALPSRDGFATLVLIDEVLMWARTKVGADNVWRHRLQDFFQCLTQAATKVSRCAIVASLLATDPAKSDELGREIISELHNVFQRARDEAIQPVERDEVAEILRRRLFNPESLAHSDRFRPEVVAAVQGISELDEQTRKDYSAAESRFLRSYPFHPDLTDVFYGKWTGIDRFQRTRGVLRTFALALREAEGWDDCPLIGPNVFLSPMEGAGISEAARELTDIAGTQADGGSAQNWAAIVDGELAKAREIQRQFPSLRHREVEQAVFATFLHSQPVGRRALTRELLLLLGQTDPDRIDLEQALRRWSEESWFLDESEFGTATAGADGQKGLPKAWRLGPKPNLRQMHHDARPRVEPLVEDTLARGIASLKSLTSGASGAGARVHNLPSHPREVEDDGQFHYVVLGPSAACDVGRPSAEARRFIEETTSADRPRVAKNALVLAVPSRDGLEAARDAVRDHLAWEEVREQLKGQPLDPIREGMLADFIKDARDKIPGAIRQAYCMVVTLSAKGVVEAFKVTVGTDPLFMTIKADKAARIQDSAVSADALLPDGPYDLWKGETCRWVKDLVGAFAERSDLPKMLGREAILDTLVAGCLDGLFAMRLARPDRSYRTFWRERPDDIALKDSALEVVLPEAATLSSLSPSLLAPGVLPGLWASPEITLEGVLEYFSGAHMAKIQREGYEEALAVPKATREVVEGAVKAAVESGKLWLTSGAASVLGEPVPPGLLADDAVFQAPPKAISPLELAPDNLAEAWKDGATTALAISKALSARSGKTLPWAIIRDAIDPALRYRMIERAPDSASWPSAYSEAASVVLRVPVTETPKPPDLTPKKPESRRAEAELETVEIQDLSDSIATIKSAATSAGYTIKFRVTIELVGKEPPSDEVVEKLNRALGEVSSKLSLK